MKKTKYVMIGLILSVILGCLIYTFILSQNKKVAENFLILNTYINYAWSFQFNGTAIDEMGTIYTWDEKDNLKFQYYNLSDPKSIRKFIKNEANKTNKKVKLSDLNKIKKYVLKLKDDIEIRSPGADQGTKTISVINENNIEIVLKKTGDSIGENKTNESKKILKILEKYF